MDDTVRRGNDTVWRYVFNDSARRHHARCPPALGSEAARVLACLRADGVAVTDLATLTGDDTLLGRLQAHAGVLEEAARDRVEAARRGEGGSPKPFLVELLDTRRPAVHPRDPLAAVALHAQLKGLADSYFGLTTTVSDVNVWRNLPVADAPTSSQLWHRDLPEDRILLKAFIYLEPVTDGSGPFCYAPGTHAAGRGAGTRLPDVEHDGVNYRIRAGALADELAAGALVATGAPGTLVVADMRGYHRGGMATTSSRLLLQLRYTSRTATRNNMLSAPPGVEARAWRRDLAYDRRRPRRRAV